MWCFNYPLSFCISIIIRAASQTAGWGSPLTTWRHWNALNLWQVDLWASWLWRKYTDATQCSPQVTNHTNKHTGRGCKNTCLETSLLCWNVDTITVIQHTHTHTSFFCLKRSQRPVFPFCLKKPCVRDSGTKEKWEGKGLKVTNWRTEHKSRAAVSLEVWLF